MADNKIEIIASLNIPKSKHNIVGEIKQLQADLQADDNARPKLIAGLDIDKSKKLIQSQLDTFITKANAPTIKVGIDVSSTKNISTAINEQLGKTNVTTNVTDKILNNYRKTFGIVGKEANDKLRPLFASFENAFNTANAEKYYSVLRKIVDTTVSLATSRKPNDYNDLMKNIKSQVTDGSKIYIDSRTREDLKSMLGDANQLKSVLNSVFGGGKWTFNAGKGAASFDTLVSPELLNRCQGLADCIVEVHRQISQLKGQRISVFDGITDSQIKSFIELEIQDLLKLGLTADYVEGEWVDLTGTVNTSNQTLADSASKMSTITTAFDNTSSAVNRAEQEYRELFNVTKQGDVTGIWNKDTNGNINGFTVNVKKAKGETESFRYVLKQVGEEMQFVYAGGRGSDSGVYKLQQYADKIKALRTDLASTLKGVGQGYLDTNVAKPITDTSHIKTLNEQYVHALRTIGELRNADSTTMASMKANAEKEIDALKRLVKQFQNAEYAATSLRDKGIDTTKQIELNNLNKLSSQISGSNIKDISGLLSEVERLKSMLNGSFDKNVLTDYLNQVDILKSKFDALNTEAKTLADLQKSITTAIGNLDSKKLNSTFTRNNTNPEVVQQIAKIDELKVKYQNLLSLISQPQTPESLTKLRNETLLLDRDYQLLIQSVKNFQGTLRNDKTIDVNANKMKQLRAEIQAYMNLNPKAMNMKLVGGNTVGVELNRILSQLNDLASPELAASIGRQFKTIGKTVVSMGKEGNTAFGSLLASAKKFGTWMGITGFISGFIRNIRKMITNVIELDTAMTNLKKVTDETTATYSKFFDSATERAKELGITIKDLISATSEFAKLGYNLQDAQKLGEVASVYANVGELDISESTSSLVSTLAAFKIEAKDAIKVIDKFNSVGNKFSISSAGIGESLQRSASSLKAAGNTLDESISLITAAKRNWLRI